MSAAPASRPFAPDSLLRSLPRYAGAGCAAASITVPAVNDLGIFGSTWLELTIGLSLAAVLVTGGFVLGLPLRIQSINRRWNAAGVAVLVAVIIAVLLQKESERVLTTLLGQPLEKLPGGPEWAEAVKFFAEIATVLLLANFPDRARIGSDFTSSFSRAKRRLLLGFCSTGLLLVAAWWTVPAPLSGYWHTPFSDCLCASKNLLVFEEDGQVHLWSTAHRRVREPQGSYTREGRWVVWQNGEETVRLRPGWWLMRIQVENSPPSPPLGWIGRRELDPAYIREVLATKPTPAARP